MIQDSGQVRRQGAQDFWGYYEVACARQESVPLPAVKANLHKHMLDFNGDRLKLPDWQPVLASISINKHLQHIAISSTYQASVALREAERRLHRSTIRRKIPAIRSKDVTFKLCKALRDCLSVSSNLRTLQLHGLPLRERDLIMLTKGLAKSDSLENFSLANCPIMDEGLEVICQSVMYSTSIKWVDFSGCSLTWRGAEHMANIVKHQGLQRHGTAWAESLRYRLPRFEQMLGLRRLTLNSNSLIGDRGAVSLARELAEDLWVKAVDLQRCGLSNEGARRLLEALKTNSSLCVLDIRNNPLVDKPLVRTIIERVLMNPDAQSSEYSWIKPASPEPQRACGPKRRLLLNSTREKSTSKTKVADKKTSLKEQNSSVAHTQRSCYRSSGVPWRAAARAERQRALPPGVTVSAQKLQAAASVKITLESDSGREDDEDEEKEEEPVVVEVNHRPSPVSVRDRKFEHIQVELKECRLMLAEEKRARLQAESHIMKCEVENTRLRDANRSLLKSLAAAGCTSGPAAVSVLEDEAIIESIENSFTKFHAFLDLLKDAGLGQLASMAGIDNSDFQCLGKPQLSSTLFPNNSNGAATPNGGAKTGTGSLDGGAALEGSQTCCRTWP
ncbi:centrosomal protein of 78 kDa isoform X2 [Gouania willdenowi]|uniref:centrosomal protein of 78 kDa isoform X2 n=1 Tax=Gouania willdenowi TaxID=441366 RepID=UPI0010569E5B|nr:centrosomal protein of 78 kDa isoform X2 [Gouania willdenowi]